MKAPFLQWGRVQIISYFRWNIFICIHRYITIYIHTLILLRDTPGTATQASSNDIVRLWQAQKKEGISVHSEMPRHCPRKKMPEIQILGKYPKISYPFISAVQRKQPLSTEVLSFCSYKLFKYIFLGEGKRTNVKSHPRLMGWQ